MFTYKCQGLDSWRMILISAQYIYLSLQTIETKLEKNQRTGRVYSTPLFDEPDTSELS